MDSQCPGCLGQAVVTSRLPCAIVESPWRHKHVPFVNIAFLRSRSIKRPQWKHRLDYYGVVFAHLATGRGIKAKDPSGLDSDRWIPHSRCCENPARAKALAGFSRHLSAGFTDLNPAPRGLSLYKIHEIWTCVAPAAPPLFHAAVNLCLQGESPWNWSCNSVNLRKSTVTWMRRHYVFTVISRWSTFSSTVNVCNINCVIFSDTHCSFGPPILWHSPFHAGVSVY